MGRTTIENASRHRAHVQACIDIMGELESEEMLIAVTLHTVGDALGVARLGGRMLAEADAYARGLDWDRAIEIIRLSAGLCLRRMGEEDSDRRLRNEPLTRDSAVVARRIAPAVRQWIREMPSDDHRLVAMGKMFALASTRFDAKVDSLVGESLSRARWSLAAYPAEAAE